MPFGLRKFRRYRDKKASHNTAKLAESLGTRSIVLVGLMGAGKSSVGRRLANELSLTFVDADNEIEAAAQKSISEIFADHGEEYFRTGEEKVIKRLLESGPQILATGGGAFMSAKTRDEIKQHGISVWIKAELDVLVSRVSRRDNRPLLKNGDPKQIMQKLMDERYPVYSQADITVLSREVPHEDIVREIIDKLARYLANQKSS